MTLEDDVDQHWLLFGGVLVIFMHSGFTLLEVGSVKRKNTKNILSKNLMLPCVSALLWWWVGYGFAFGEDNGNGFIGTDNFGGSGAGFEPSKLQSYTNNETFVLPGEGNHDKSAFWFFQFSFCATAATIVSGAVAERLKLEAYVVYTIVLTSFVYPCVAHWAWGGGWAAAQTIGGYDVAVIDFAGSGVVHMVGGMAALVGILVIGPRKGRFADSGRTSHINLSENDFSGQSTTFCVLGTFILWVGWYGFNCASTGGISGAGHLAGHVAETTTIAAATAGCSSFLLSRYTRSHWDPAGAMNGILAGLVAITAGCANVEAYGAFCIGLIAGPLYVLSSHILVKARVDDVVDAVPVHLVNGIWGVLAPGFFSSVAGSCGVFYSDKMYEKPDGSESDVPFRECGGSQWSQLGAQVCFILAVLAWVGTFSAVMFLTLKKMNMLRVSAEVEEQGLDEHEHGGKAYEAHRIEQAVLEMLEKNGSVNKGSLAGLLLPVPIAASANSSETLGKLESIA